MSEHHEHNHAHGHVHTNNKKILLISFLIIGIQFHLVSHSLLLSMPKNMQIKIKLLGLKGSKL